jgi:esterase/lipase
LPGHGLRPPDLLQADRRAWFEAAEAALLALPPPVSIAGLSMGALLATCLAAEHRERVPRLALLAPAVQLTQPAQLVAHVFHRFPALLRHFRALHIGASSDLRDPTLRHTNPKNAVVSLLGLAELNALQGEALAAAARVFAPALICLGAKDRTVTRRGVLRLAGRLGGPKRVEVFANSGHQLALDFDRAAVIAAVLAHFEAIG